MVHPEFSVNSYMRHAQMNFINPTFKIDINFTVEYKTFAEDAYLCGTYYSDPACVTVWKKTKQKKILFNKKVLHHSTF